MLHAKLTAGLIGVAALLTSTTATLAATEITFWHAMGAELGKKLEQIVDGYNKSQSTYHVTPVFKGTYPEAMNGAIAAFRAHQQPDIVQVFEVGTGTMMAAKGAVYPVYQLMKDTGNEWDPKQFLPAVVGYYTDTDGNMLSFPFNSSTPILYYNKDEFQKAGLDPNTPPKTWEDLVNDSKKLMSSGAAKCGFTSGWITWIQTENFSAWHNVPIGTEQNGFGGLDAELKLNGPLQVRHWDNLKKWSDAGIFEYGGPVGGDDAPPKFYSGECAIYMNSSGSRAAVLQNSKFNVGFGFLPYYGDVKGAPQNTIIGGATLWVLQGHTPEEYKGVADFFKYLSTPAVQAEWHQFSGYLPITPAAYELSKEQGYYDKNPGADVAIKQLTRVTPDANSKGIRFGNYVQIRKIESDDAVAMLGGQMSPKEAVDDIVKRGNELLREFEAANQ
ncbi:MAG: sn-glycerol-3-phosphate ABC transporter substrate-binding protein UgpB [Devosia sp.]